MTDPGDERRRDRLRGLLIVSVAFLASLCVAWWAQRQVSSETGEPPAPPTLEGVVGHPDKVDVLATLAAARTLTLRKILRGIEARNVAADGTADLTAPGTSGIRYVFQSERGVGPQPPRPSGTVSSRRYCGRQEVAVGVDGLVAKPDQSYTACDPAPAEPLPEPRCGPREVWRYAIDTKHYPQQGRATIEYYASRVGPAWRFSLVGRPDRFTLYGDCRRELLGADSFGRVP